MPSPTVITPQMERVRQLADQAKDSREGLTIYFRVSQYGSLEACNSRARGMQSSFSALRAKTRRLAMNMSQEPSHTRDVMTKGPYDNIACIKSTLPGGDGYSIEFIPNFLYALDLEIVDRATGEPLAAEDPNINRYAALGLKLQLSWEAAQRSKALFTNPLTPDEITFMYAHDDEFTFHTFGAIMPRPGGGMSAVVEEDDKPFDLADLPDDVDIFGEGE